MGGSRSAPPSAGGRPRGGGRASRPSTRGPRGGCGRRGPRTPRGRGRRSRGGRGGAARAPPGQAAPPRLGAGDVPLDRLVALPVLREEFVPLAGLGPELRELPDELAAGVQIPLPDPEEGGVEDFREPGPQDALLLELRDLRGDVVAVPHEVPELAVRGPAVVPEDPLDGGGDALDVALGQAGGLA